MVVSRSSSTEASLYEIIRDIRPLYRALEKAVIDRLEGTGITVGMRAVLERLLDEGPQTVPQIGRFFDIQRQFIQRVVNTLMELKLVQTMENPAHARSSLIGLTPKGKKAIEQILEREQKVLRQVAKDFDPREVAVAQKVIAEFTKQFRAIAAGETK